jgi:hypothetical protein
MSYNYSAIPHFQELFDTHVYIFNLESFHELHDVHKEKDKVESNG